MRSALVAALVTTVLVGGACTSSRADSPAATTTTTSRSSTTTTSTTLAKTNDPAFHTQKAGVLTVATDHPMAPYFDIDATTGLAYDGFEYDVARVLASRLGLGRVRVVQGSLPAIARGFDCRCDLYLGGVTVTEALARKVDLSVPYVSADPVVVVRADAPAPTEVTAPTLRWAVVAGDDDAATALAQRVDPVLAARTLPSPEAALHAVAAGDVDASLVPGPIGLLAAQADPTLKVVARLDAGAGWAVVEPLGSSNSPSLNDLLEGLTADGTLAFIARRHLGVDPATLPSFGAK